MKSEKPLVLIVDDEDVSLTLLDTIISANNLDTLLCRDSREVIPCLKKNLVSVILLDLYMPNITGLDLLKILAKDYPHIPVIVITADNKVDIAVTCMKRGAFDFLTKPVEKPRLISIVRHALENYTLRKEVNELSEKMQSGGLKNPEIFADIVTKNPVMHNIFRYIEAVAQSPKCVLITGESGTGKELFAKAVHSAGILSGKFVPVNAAGLDDTVFSDTLFGHKRGAFTSADRDRKGLIEQASGGTLFLDEIGDLENSSQIKLLRLLQEGEYYQLGADSPSTAKIRIIAATNADLSEKVEKGLFRKDLYYRMIAHHIEIPPLRERIEDIPELVSLFITEASKSMSRKNPTLPAEIYTLLKTYHYPGNIRELQSIIFDAVSRHRSGILSLALFKDYFSKHGGLKPEINNEVGSDSLINFNITPFPTLKAVQDCLITEALQRAEGNQSIASRLLGISQSTLSRRQMKDN